MLIRDYIDTGNRKLLIDYERQWGPIPPPPPDWIRLKRPKASAGFHLRLSISKTTADEEIEKLSGQREHGSDRPERVTLTRLHA